MSRKRDSGIDCHGRIVRAHTVPKSGSLKQIAVDGHVYHIEIPIDFTTWKSSALTAKALGINKASTFTGFCEKHDKHLFAPIEDSKFIGTLEQCLLLGYRAIAREFFHKKRAAGMIPFLKQADRGRGVLHQLNIQNTVRGYDLGVSAGLRDLEIHKQSYEGILSSTDYSDVRYYIIELQKPPDIMCSAAINPEFDFEGQKLFDLSDPRLVSDVLTVSAFASNKSGFVVFTWLAASNLASKRFIGSLHRISDTDLPDALVRLFFEFAENVYMSPVWFDNLHDEEKAAIYRRVPSGASMATERSQDCLSDDGIHSVSWKVLRRDTNCQFNDYFMKPDL